MSKSTIIMLGLIVFAVLGGPLIFYGLLSAGEAGVFENALDNFWWIAGAAIVFIVVTWVSMLAVGNLALKSDSHKEQRNG